MRRTRRVLGLVVLALSLTGCWPMPGQNPDRTNYNELETTLTPATVGDLGQKWTWAIPAPPEFPFAVHSLVVSQSGVHLTGASCTLVTLDPATGQQKWLVDTVASRFCYGIAPSSGAEIGSPWVVGDVVHVGSTMWAGEEFDWICGSATDGYDVRTGSRQTSSGGAVAALRDDFLVGSRCENNVDGLRTYTPTFATIGQPASPVPGVSGQWSDGAVAVGADAVFVIGNWHQTITAYSRADWSVRWTWTAPGGPVELPVLAGGRLYVAANDANLYSISAADGSVAAIPVGSPLTGPPALAQGVFYVPTQAGLKALDGAGTVLWTAPQRPSGQPAVAGDVVYTRGSDSLLRAYDANGCGAATCPALWTSGVTVGDAPVISNGQVYAVTADGRGVTAFGLP